MPDDSQTLPDAGALAATRDELVALNASRAWYSLAVLGTCIAFWSAVVALAVL